MRKRQKKKIAKKRAIRLNKYLSEILKQSSIFGGDVEIKVDLSLLR